MQTSKINDGTNTAAIKAASTAALATDTSLVVAMSPNSALPTGANTIGAISNTTFAATQSGTWNITNVSGTVSLPTGAATASNQTTLGLQTTQINDGTNTAAIKASSTAALATDTSLVVAMSPNSALPTGANTIGAVTQSGNWNFGTSAPGVSTDIASAAITTTTTSSNVTPNNGNYYSTFISVTAVSGTNPTLDVQIQESDDTGTNWVAVYDFPRITATGVYRSAPTLLVGNRIRYVQTVGGTTPSFTRSLVRLQMHNSAVLLTRQLIDRTISLTTLSSSTPALYTMGCRNVKIVVSIGAATTPPTLQMQGSDDYGATWYSLGAAVAAVASSTVNLTNGTACPQFLRATVTVAGVAVTPSYVLLRGF